MEVFTCNNFKGHWPVGGAAVVVASNAAHAAKSLEEELTRIGLNQKVREDQMVPLSTDAPSVRILVDGDY